MRDSGKPAARSCIVVTRFAREQPGFLDFSYRIRALAKIFQLTVVSDFPLNHAELVVEGVEYLVLPGGDGRAGWLRYIWACGKLLRARQPQCAVLLHSAVAPVALLAPGIATALYWNEHPTHFAAAPDEIAPLRRLSRFLARWLLFQGARKATIVMPIGEAHRDDLLAQGCVPQRVRLFYMGVDAAFDSASLRGLGRTPDDGLTPLELVYVGSISKERGRDIMLEALALANRDSCIARLTLVGASDDELAYCREYARQIGIDDALNVRGRIPGAEIPGCLQQADAGLCLWEDRPWWRFNPPTKLFEYLVAGLPVLASDIRTHTAYVADGSNGFIFRYDSISLAKAIAQMWHRRGDLHQLKRQARDSGEPYIWQRIEPAFLQTMEEIAKS
ncbi:glycosyltransferase family 4 protein [Janthinobacterium sp. 17J80-10]|uniref:glycosyltransferase family 4 protein n=1 Tax=Janthinobacterium sp. 17J80-10 TaxID=2497863 RepID=UPI001005670F|nr:glycosyltransferase family 4 protein [Janthinobacterium sp. 17J80-10]QAU34443.1 glycosyltransferase [Janthinobacterium sp. 17J80-10]